MVKIKDGSYIKNVDNFREIINECTSFSIRYNPPRDELKIPALTTQLQNVDAVMQEVKNSNTAHINAINQRKIVFKDFRPIISRAFKFLKACGVAKETISSVRTVYNLVMGRRATPKKEVPADAAATEVPRSASVSKQSHTNKVDHFVKMLTILRTEPKYVPNEEDLKIENLEIVLQKMRDANNNVSIARTNVQTARTLRKEALNADLTGLVDVANDIKQYVGSVFGTSSDQYKRVKKLIFKKITD